MSDIASSLVLGVKTEAARANLSELSKSLDSFKATLKDFNKSVSETGVFEGLSQEAKQALKTSAAEVSGAGGKAVIEAFDKVGQESGARFTVATSKTLSNGLRVATRQVGTDLKAMAAEVNKAAAQIDTAFSNTSAKVQNAGDLKNQRQQASGALKELKDYQASLQGEAGFSMSDYVAQLRATLKEQTKLLDAEQAKSEAIIKKRAESIVAAATLKGYKPANKAEFEGLLNVKPTRVGDPLTSAQQNAYAYTDQGISARNQAYAEDKKRTLAILKPATAELKAYEDSLAREAGIANLATSAHKSLGSELEATAAKHTKVFLSAEILGEKLKLTNTAARELVVILHEYMSGRTANIPGSFLTLLSTSGISASGILSTVGALGLLAAAVVTLKRVYVDSKTEVDSMNRAIEASGNFAGVTRDSMLQVSAQVSQSSNLTISESKAAVSAIVSSGQISSKVWKGVAGDVSEYSKITGKTAEQSTQDLIRIFSDPTKGAEELAKNMALLNPVQLEHVKMLQEQGRLSESQAALQDAVNDRFKDTKQELGTLQQVARDAGHAFSNFWDNVLAIGRPETPEEKIRNITEFMRQNKAMAAIGSGASADTLKEMEAQRREAVDQARVSNTEAFLRQQSTEANKINLQKYDAVQNTPSSQINSLRAQGDLLNGTDTAKSSYEAFIAYQNEAKAGVSKQLDLELGIKAAREQTLAVSTVELNIQNKKIEQSIALGQITNQAAIRQKEITDLAILEAQIKKRQADPAVGPRENAEKSADLAQLRAQAGLIRAQANSDVSVDKLQGRIAATQREVDNAKELLDVKIQQAQQDEQLGYLGSKQLANKEAELKLDKIALDRKAVLATPEFGTSSYMEARAEKLQSLANQEVAIETDRANKIRDINYQLQNDILHNLAEDRKKTGDELSAYYLNFAADNLVKFRQAQAQASVDGDTSASDAIITRRDAGAQELSRRVLRDRIQGTIEKFKAEDGKLKADSLAGVGPLYTPEKQKALLQEYLVELDNLQAKLAELGGQGTAEVEKQLAAVRKNVETLRKQVGPENWSTGMRAGVAEYLDSIGTLASQTKTLVSDSLKGLEDGLVEFTKTGKLDFRSLADSIISDLIRMQVRAQLTGLFGGGDGINAGGVISMFSGSGGGLGDLIGSAPLSEAGTGSGIMGAVSSFLDLFSAKGNAFTGTGVQPFAKGGAFGSGMVLTKPTLFPFAMGGSFGNGVAGEAGPEAALPLKRMSNGNLGVYMEGGGDNASGGGVTNIVNITVQGGNNPAETGDIISQKVIIAMQNVADQRILNATRLGGVLNKAAA